jgi:hypothetical protein
MDRSLPRYWTSIRWSTTQQNFSASTKKKQNLEFNALPVVRGNSGKNLNQYEQDVIEALWQFGRIVW